MKKIIFIIIMFLTALFTTTIAYGQTAQQPSFVPSLIPITTNKYYLGSTTPDRVWAGLYVNQICLSGDCKTIWPTGGGGSGGGTFSTTTVNSLLLQYPYTTLITNLDGTATTTSDFWFDPFISKTFFSFGSSTAFTTGNLFVTSPSQGYSFIGSNGKLDTVSTSTLAGQVFPFTSLTGYNATSTVLGLLNGLFSTASSTFSGNLFLPALSQGLLYNGSLGLTGSTATTSASCSGSVSCSSFTVIGASPITITGSGGSGGGLGTTTPWTPGQVSYVVNDSTLTSVATGTLSVPTGLTVTGNRYVIGGNANIGLDTGYVIPLQSTLDAKALGATTITVNGTANQIISSAGAQDLSANRTWTLSFPNLVIFPSNASSTLFSTSYASTTDLRAGTITFGGVTGSTWSSFCNSITGSSGLCDGVDDTSSGGNSLASTTPWTFGDLTVVATNGSIKSLSTSTLVNNIFPFTSYGFSTSSIFGLQGGFLSTASSTIVGNATTTGGQYVGGFYGAGLTACNYTTEKLLWLANGTFTCGTDNGGGSSASSTLLADTNYWSGKNTFTNATSTSFGVGDLFAISSAGMNLHANNGTDIAIFGAGNSANSTFYGGVTINGLLTFPYSSSTIYSSFTTASSTQWLGGGLSSCSNGTTEKLLYNSTTGQFSCGADQTGGGGSAGGTWATTTSTVSGQLINYPNNNTDIVTVGANSTTSAKVYFDPNYSSGTTKLAVTNKGNVALGTTTQSGGEVLDEVFAKSMMIEDMYLPCDTNSAITIAADGLMSCGWYYAEDTAAGSQISMSSPTGGGISYGRVIDPNPSSGAGIFVPGDQTGWIGVATNTPVLETNFRISDPTLASSTTYYIGFGNLNYAGATFEATPTNFIGFIASSTQANWQAVTINSAVILQTDTGIASTTKITGVGQFRKFRVEAGFDYAKFYIQSAGGAMSLVATHTGTSIPDDINDVMIAGVWFGRVVGGGNAGFDVYKSRFKAQLPLPTFIN